MSMTLPSSDDYQSILLSGAPLLDLRAPVEFAQGAFPGAVNLPLLNDSEREQVGIAYKQHGPQAALELGHRLVSGACKAERVAAWHRFAAAHPNGYLYCFRGGQRSKISQQWLAEAGIVYPRISGGYKAMRQFLLQALEDSVAQLPILILGGCTGVAKTQFLRRQPHSVDLEALAHHRGSAFGRELTPQPTPINFENALSIALLQLRQQGAPWVLLEDEGRNIGSLSVPQRLVEVTTQAPLLILNAPLAVRIAHILQEYIIDKRQDYQRYYGDEQGFKRFAAYLFDSLARIQKRLGAVRHRQLQDVMQDALAAQRVTGSVEEHRAWIEILLRDYYDPMYDYQLARKQHRVVLQGDSATLNNWLASTAPQPFHPA